MIRASPFTVTTTFTSCPTPILSCKSLCSIQGPVRTQIRGPVAHTLQSLIVQSGLTGAVGHSREAHTNRNCTSLRAAGAEPSLIYRLLTWSVGMMDF